MKKTLPVMFAAAFAGMALGQNPTGSQFQAPGWMAGPLANVMGGGRQDAQPGPVTGKPFTGTEVRHTRQTLSDGTPTDQTETTAIYRDPDGRMRMESGSNVVIYDPVARVEYHLNTEKKTFVKSDIGEGVTGTSIAVTSHGTFTSNGARNRMNGGGGEDLGLQVVNGISAKGARTTINIPGKSLGADHDLKVVNERWYSEELGVLVKSTNSDPRFGTTTYDLTNLSQSAPDAGLFRVPADYQENNRPARLRDQRLRDRQATKSQDPE